MDVKKYQCVECGVGLSVRDKPVMSIRNGKPTHCCKTCFDEKNQSARPVARPKIVAAPANNSSETTSCKPTTSPAPANPKLNSESSPATKPPSSNGLSVNLKIDESEGSAKASIAIVPKDEKERKHSRSSSSSSSDDEKPQKAKTEAPNKIEEPTLVTEKPSGACFICNQEIDGTFYTCGELKYHEKCITCHECGKTNRSDWRECVVYPSDDGASINFFCPECNVTRAKKCHKCQEPILDGALMVGNNDESKKHYHAKCLVCGHCGANMSKGEDLVYLNGVLTCAKCRKEQSINCHKCKETIMGNYNSIKEDSVDSGKLFFHDKCFLCIYCDTNLNDVDIGGKTENKEVYCKPCYLEKFCEKCTRCSAALIGAFFRVAGEKICKNCCKCGGCGVEITGQFTMKKDGAFQCLDKACQEKNRAEE